MMVSQDFEHSALVPLATLGQPVCQELYRDVAMIRSWASRKNGRNQGGMEKEKVLPLLTQEEEISLGMRPGRRNECGGSSNGS